MNESSHAFFFFYQIKSEYTCNDSNSHKERDIKSLHTSLYCLVYLREWGSEGVSSHLCYSVLWQITSLISIDTEDVIEPKQSAMADAQMTESSRKVKL